VEELPTLHYTNDFSTWLSDVQWNSPCLKAHVSPKCDLRRLENTPKSAKHNETMGLEALNQRYRTSQNFTTSETFRDIQLRFNSVKTCQDRRPAQQISNSGGETIASSWCTAWHPNCPALQPCFQWSPCDENRSYGAMSLCEVSQVSAEHPSLVGRHADTVSNDACLRNTLIRRRSMTKKYVFENGHLEKLSKSHQG
jgi:hypothetical protein